MQTKYKKANTNMKRQNTILLSALVGTCWCAVNCAGAEQSQSNTNEDTQKLIEREAKKEAQVTTGYDFAATVSVDYFRYDVEFAPGGQTGFSHGFGSGKMKGDLEGATLALSHGNLYVDGSFRLGTITGDISYGNVSSSDEVNRTEAEIRVTLRKGMGLFGAKNLGGWIGGSYTYVAQDYTETLPTGFVWISTGTRTRTYDDTLHNFLGEVGLQYTFLLLNRDNATIRLIPKALGGLGGANYGQDSTAPGVDTDLWQFGFKWQGTGQLEFTFYNRHTLFLEGGYRRTGFWQSEGNALSQDYYGPYARVGYSFAF
jgi:hypothetical protein